MAYIIDGIRVPTGKAGGYYKKILPEQLTAFLLAELLRRNSLKASSVDEIILANSFGTGGNMARYAALLAGFPESVPATTLDMQCAGGLKSIMTGDSLISAGAAGCIMAGGMESNSLAPEKSFHVNDPRYDPGKASYKIARFSPGQTGDQPLLDAAHKVAKQLGISKEAMQRWTVRSFEKASDAWSSGVFNDVVVPFSEKKTDQTLRSDINLESLLKVQTDELIDFTNTAHHHDGAAVVLLGDENFVHANRLKPKARIVASASAGCDPEQAPLGLIRATEKLLQQPGISIKEIDLFEVNESFALKPLAFSGIFGVSEDKINVLGGNLAFGHPFGASGAMNMIHLIRALELKQKKYGLVTMAAAGGLGVAVLIERISEKI